MIVSDGPRRSTSGLRRGSVRVSFGEGGGARPRVGARRGSDRGRRPKGKGKKKPVTVRVSHVYEHAGRYRLAVRARDKAGNVTGFERR